MTEPVLGYLRIRVVNTSPLFYFTDGFEGTSSVRVTLWNSIGTDTTGTLSYWATDAGVPTIASNVVTMPISAQMRGGHADTGDCTYRQRITNYSNTNRYRVGFHASASNSFIFVTLGGGVLNLQKDIAGTITSVSGPACTPTAASNCWVQLIASGTTYTAQVFTDSGGAMTATQVGTDASGTISDASVQTGQVMLGTQSDSAAACTYGGAFATVCTVIGTPPDGTQGQAWAPVVTTGEPAFAWSKNSPQTGTFSASIYNGNSSGNGAWQQKIRLFSGSNVTLSAQAKASAGTANVSAGGLTTGNAGTAFGAITAAGAITANPTVSCNYTGAVGTAYFDSLSITNPAYEVTNDLPHLHKTHIEVVAMQPGNPGSSALGSFRLPLYPPGTEQFAAAKAIYDQLDYGQRLEFYISPDGASLGKLYYAGIITGIRKNYGQSSVYEVTGVSDLFWLNYSKPFPGEALTVNYNSGSAVTADVRQAKNYFGTNELGWTDSFVTFTATNYTSTLLPGLTAGTWSSSTDEGLNVVSCATGTGAVLVAQSGAQAGDASHQHFVEVSGRLKPSADTTNGGQFGVGLAQSFGAGQVGAGAPSGGICVVAYARAVLNNSTGRYDLDVIAKKIGGTGSTLTATALLTNVDDPDGFIPITISYHAQMINGSMVVVNGRPIIAWPNSPNSYDLGAASGTVYPFLFFGAPATGTATAYFVNLVQQVRFTDDLNTGIAAFKSGTIGTAALSLPLYSDPSPTFLEVITRVATREGWYWRYTPKTYVGGVRTLGTIDLTTDPGADRGTNGAVAFSRTNGNLVELELSANADQIASGTVVTAVSGTDGAGIASWRDISTMTKYGVIDDQVLAVPASGFAEQRKAAVNIMANKVALGKTGSKTATVLRDPQTADVWRELDKVMIHDPELGINYLVARVIGYTFEEGQATQTLTLDQFGVDNPTLLAKRFQLGVFQTTLKFGNR